MIGSLWLRSLVRRLGLQMLLHPFVLWVERRRADRLGSYEVRVDGDDVEFTLGGRGLRLLGLPEAQRDLACSSHERPIIATMLSRVTPGMVVWDVGANVGFYTRLLAELTGAEGWVVAFEPSGSTFAELTGNVGGLRQVRLRHEGVSDQEGEVKFATPADHSSAGRIMEGEGGEVIRVVRGDGCVASGERRPGFIKLDVEGHEWQALGGMREVLAHASCRCVLVEVHFTLLERNGLREAPAMIEALLRECGLSQQQWVARSHLLAERP